jgi:hypothetical protein
MYIHSNWKHSQEQDLIVSFVMKALLPQHINNQPETFSIFQAGIVAFDGVRRSQYSKLES